MQSVKKHETNYGFRCVKDGASFSEHVRRVTTTPEDVYNDPMHCWYSSGGIAQLHVNCLLQKFIANHALGAFRLYLPVRLCSLWFVTIFDEPPV